MIYSLINSSIFLASCFIIFKYKTTLDRLYRNNRNYNYYVQLYVIVYNSCLSIYSIYASYYLFMLMKTNNMLLNDFIYNDFKIDNYDKIYMFWLSCQLIIIQFLLYK